MGHSLGAAAASIAAMELKEHEEWMTVDALGFGCPSLLSKELSESAKDYITTVVADADVVPVSIVLYNQLYHLSLSLLSLLTVRCTPSCNSSLQPKADERFINRKPLARCS